MPRKINTTRTANTGTLKDGIYPMVVLDAEETTSKSGNDMIALQLSVTKNGKPVGRVIYDWLVFDDEGAKDEDKKRQWKFDQFHDALGVDEGMAITYKWYKGKKFFATLVTDEHQGKIKNKVDSYLDPEVAQDLLAKRSEDMGDQEDEDEDELDTTPAPEPAKAKAQTKRGRQPVAEMEEEDDIPF